MYKGSKWHDPLPRQSLKILAGIVGAVFSLFGGQRAGAQDSNYNSQLVVGFPSNGTFEGNSVVSVNLDNLNLHIQIPYFSLPGRGLSESYSFIYDSENFSYTAFADYDTTLGPQGIGGVTGVEDGNLPGVTEDDYSEYSCSLPSDQFGGETPVEQTISTLYAVEGNGTRHQMFPTNVVVPPNVTGCDSNATTTFFAGDGSGWMIQYIGNEPILYDKHGTATHSPFSVYPPATRVNVPVPLPLQEDTNGNESLLTSLTYTSSSYTDTLGRVGTSGTSYTDTSGVQHPIEITTIGVQVGQTLPNATVSADGQAIHTITLADGAVYTFTYTSALEGQVESLTVPSGAKYEFTYGDFNQAGGSTGSPFPPDPGLPVVNGRPLRQKKLTIPAAAGAVNTAATVLVWNYSISGLATTVTDPSGNDTVILHAPAPVNVGVTVPGYPQAVHSYVTTTNYAGTASPNAEGVAGARVALKQTVVDNSTFYSEDGSNRASLTAVTLPTATTTTWAVAGILNGPESRTETDYQFVPLLNPAFVTTFGNPIETREFSFGTGTYGPLYRTTNYQYAAFPGTYINDRPQSVTISDASGVQWAQDLYGYDEWGLTNASATNHDASFGATNVVRGNLTSHKRWVSGTKYDTTDMYYDTLGNVLKTTVTDGTTSRTVTMAYDDSFADRGLCLPATVSSTKAFATMITAGGFSKSRSYYSCTGQLANDRTANDIASSLPGASLSYDSMLRTSGVTLSSGAYRNYQYSDAASANSMTVTIGGKPGEPVISQTTNFDGLHRGAVVSTSGDSTTVTEYDPNGKVSKVYYPFPVGAPASSYKQYTYDALGRPSTFADSGGTTSITYSGNTTTSLDPRSLPHQKVIDAFGRVTGVLEPAKNSSSASYGTSYGYDVLGNLTGVSQTGDGVVPSVVRAFTYDGESRLITANNPESGITCYGVLLANQACTEAYDGGGNLLYKTDAIGHTTSYLYDSLNRLTQKTYFVPPNSTASSCYLYDTATNGVGKLAMEWTQSGGNCSSSPGTSYITMRGSLAYDAGQNLTDEQQCTRGYCTPASSTSNALHSVYDSAGRLLSYTNGAGGSNGANSSGYVFGQGFDALGRLSTITEQLGGANLFTADSYTAADQISQFWLGPLSILRYYDGYNRIGGQRVITPTK